jgi:transcription-repair coupling factor (superfamily II helicase)
MAIQKKQNITLKELTTICRDYVTHIDHGIGRFGDYKNSSRKTKHRKLLNSCMLIMILCT